MLCVAVTVFNVPDTDVVPVAVKAKFPKVKVHPLATVVVPVTVSAAVVVKVLALPFKAKLPPIAVN